MYTNRFTDSDQTLNTSLKYFDTLTSIVMGFRSWLRKIYIRVREKLNWPGYSDGRYDNFHAEVYFTNGAYMEWSGRPWGSEWERFKRMMEIENVASVKANMSGEFWSWS